MGASASVSNSEIIDASGSNKETLKDLDLTDNNDNFAKEMFLRSPKVEGLQHVLKSDYGRESFLKFLRTEYVYHSNLHQLDYTYLLFILCLIVVTHDYSQ